MQNNTLLSPLKDARVRAVMERLLEARRIPAAGSPSDHPGVSRDPFDYAEYGFSIWPDQGDLLYLLCRGMRATRVVDFATSIGMSAIYFAAAVRDNGGGIVIGSELVPEKVTTARRNLADAGLADYADIREGDARLTLSNAGGPVDFALIDGWPNGREPSLAREVIEILAPQIYGLYGSIEEAPLDQARRQFEVNLFGLGALTQLVIPHMREQRSGKIVNISSIGGVAASPYGGWYHATKFAVEGFSSSLRQELNPFGVDVVIVRPGGVNTEWRTPAGDSLKKYSYDGPYQKAVRPALTKFMSDEFTKMLADPQNVADVIGKVVTTDHPKAIYNGTSLAGKILFIHKMMMSERLRDAFTRKFLGLPKTIQP